MWDKRDNRFKTNRKGGNDGREGASDKQRTKNVSKMSEVVRNSEECVDALITAVEEVFPDLEVTVLVLRLIATFPSYREFHRPPGCPWPVPGASLEHI